MPRLKFSTVWCEGCAGCHMSLIDLDERILNILEKIELIFSPITDFKNYAFEETDLGIIEGAVGNEEQVEIVRHLRRKSQIILALGDCAVFGGINSLRNATRVTDLMNCSYINWSDAANPLLPIHPELPKLLPNILPIQAFISVDCFIPGCPPSPQTIEFGLNEIISGRLPVLRSEWIHYD